MKRAAIIFVALLGVAGAFAALGNGGGSGNPHYTVELDNAFGLIEGGDLKIAGVRAGKITSLSLDQATHRARVGIEITRTGFGSLRSDVTCSSRPQSLIGEYFLDCQPGTAKTELESGATIPVSHTASTVAPDLVNDILRLPYRERLGLIINELGAGVGGRGGDLNSALRRAVPALQQTDRVLADLAKENTTLRDLTGNADTVLAELADNKRDIGRFVDTARAAATASAERRDQIAQTFHRFPGFLSQLTPTMAALGGVADARRPRCGTSPRARTSSTTFFGQLGPFADASRPAVRSLGAASVTGRKAAVAGLPIVQQLGSFSTHLPELSNNLRIVLQHLDDRKYAIEHDKRSPGGKGYTGLEAILQYVFDQSVSLNVFDRTLQAEDRRVRERGLRPVLRRGEGEEGQGAARQVLLGPARTEPAGHRPARPDRGEGRPRAHGAQAPRELPPAQRDAPGAAAPAGRRQHGRRAVEAPSQRRRSTSARRSASSSATGSRACPTSAARSAA